MEIVLFLAVLSIAFNVDGCKKKRIACKRRHVDGCGEVPIWFQWGTINHKDEDIPFVLPRMKKALRKANENTHVAEVQHFTTRHRPNLQDPITKYNVKYTNDEGQNCIVKWTDNPSVMMAPQDVKNKCQKSSSAPQKRPAAPVRPDSEHSHRKEQERKVTEQESREADNHPNEQTRHTQRKLHKKKGRRSVQKPSWEKDPRQEYNVPNVIEAAYYPSLLKKLNEVLSYTPGTEKAISIIIAMEIQFKDVKDLSYFVEYKNIKHHRCRAVWTNNPEESYKPFLNKCVSHT